MSKTRQGVLVRTFGLDLLSPQQFRYAAPGWDQLVYAVRGTLTVRTADSVWVLPTFRALWVPDGVDTSTDVTRAVSVRSLYFRHGFVRGLPGRCSVINVPPLLRELILHTVRIGALDARIRGQGSLAQVIADQLNGIAVVPLQLALPVDTRALRAAVIMMAEPETTIVAVARRAGASVRTLERTFRAETTMPLATWRRRARLLHALKLLASGTSVTATAPDSGYRSASAFITMFRRQLGVTPSSYFHAPAPGSAEG